MHWGHYIEVKMLCEERSIQFLGARNFVSHFIYIYYGMHKIIYSKEKSKAIPVTGRGGP
jgi:hypothetical protein